MRRKLLYFVFNDNLLQFHSIAMNYKTLQAKKSSPALFHFSIVS